MTSPRTLVRPVAADPTPAPPEDRRTVPQGHTPRRVTVRIGPCSARFDGRTAAVSVVLAAIGVVMMIWSVSAGDVSIPLGTVLAEITGLGRGDRQVGLVIHTFRWPRVLTGALVGAALGASGQMFQRLLRNPLASPDIVGVSSGATLAAVVAILVLGLSGVGVTAAAVFGAVVAVAAIYLLAVNDGVSSYRLVLIGIGLTAMFEAGVGFLLSRAQINDAQRALVWLTGSLNGRGWEYVRPLTLALVVLLPAAAFLMRQLRLVELGDDLATLVGVRTERAKLALALVAAGLAAAATAAAGPVVFVALVAPQIARRLVREQSVALVPAALVGTVLVVSADLAARRLFAPTEVPVGVLTAAVGAPVLWWLLTRANRSGSGG